MLESVGREDSSDVCRYNVPEKDLIELRQGKTLPLSILDNTTSGQRVSALKTNVKGTEYMTLEEQRSLVQEHAPILYFDNSEHWRPLDVNDYLVEGTLGPKVQGHYFCDEPNGDLPSCSEGGLLESISSPEQMAYAENQDKLMWSGGDGDHLDLSHYESPIAACRKNYYDCNSGPRSKIYGHVVPEGKYYDYIDYWIFYRFNDAPDQAFYYDEHEGDWEGLTVVVSKTDPRGGIAYALYRQHNDPPWSYLPSALLCGRDQVNGKYEFPSCTSSSIRPDSFPAAGTQADYARPCSKPALNGDIRCLKTKHKFDLTAQDSGRDGNQEWGNNDDPEDSVQLLDDCFGPFNGSCSRQPWTSWGGDWNGIQGQALFSGNFFTGASMSTVLSPAGNPYIGNQKQQKSAEGRRAAYNDPGDLTDLNGHPAGCEHRRNCGPGAERRSGRSTGDATGVPNVCATWLGPDVSVMACNPAQLTAAIQDGTIDRPGALQISGSGLASGSAPGLAQAAGKPLTPGQSLEIAGQPVSATELFVVTQVGAVLRTVSFSAAEVSLGTGRLVVSSTGGVTLLRPGQAAIRGAVINADNLTPPTAPTLISARRTGARVVVKIRARGSVTVLLVSRRGRTLTRRSVKINGTRRLVFLHAKAAFKAEATAFSPAKVASRPRERRIRVIRHRP